MKRFIKKLDSRIKAACTAVETNDEQICAYCTESLKFSDPNIRIFHTPGCIGNFSQHRRRNLKPLTGGSQQDNDISSLMSINGHLKKHEIIEEKSFKKGYWKSCFDQYSEMEMESGCPICCFCCECQNRCI